MGFATEKKSTDTQNLSKGFLKQNYFAEPVESDNEGTLLHLFWEAVPKSRC